ncbi:hypothetical protein X805_32850 [Sphaerotilus natans subsp. natans DSM 6575]|uniref:Uncharacterized protein n=1 Tax=Sphaerotilus natans subsp. natans DSM 6575 TaxID=1286631 RepID=A0A059KID7_9BURK|nr:hypothetical protein X805_32850 [Sphaerotilus natans subsp. natans DSM 6575]
MCGDRPRTEKFRAHLSGKPRRPNDASGKRIGLAKLRR